MAKRRNGIRRDVKCIVIIAGPNGAGTTFAQHYRAAEQSLKHFINADLIARGLAGDRPRQPRPDR